jgi:Tol biopolymer transport system component
MDVALSADARLLAYVSIDAGKQSLWIQELESGDKSRVLPQIRRYVGDCEFTPNGQSLFYITTQPGSTVSVLYRDAR